MYNNKLTIISDSLLGFAIGDALGVPIEFCGREYLKKNPVKDMLGYGSHKVPEGTWSDDTSMTISTMYSIAEKGTIDYDDMMNRYCDWYTNSKYTATEVTFDIGNTTAFALRNYLLGVPALNCGKKGIGDNGNGSLMRMIPIVFFAYYKNISDEEKNKLVNNYSSLTHAHEISKLGCKIYMDYIINILNGYDKYQALDLLNKEEYSKLYSKETVNKYSRLFLNGFKDLSVDNIKSSGYVVDTLEASIWCTLNNDTYEDAVSTAVNLGSDTDTVGAITGSINAILYGKKTIPDRWLSKLKKKEELENLCVQFCNSLDIEKNKLYG